MNKILFVFITLLCTLVQRAVAQNNPILWEFETEDQLNDWSFVDLDGDGYNWMYFNNTDYPIDRIQAYSGEGLMISHSFYKEGRIPLTPDNWLISPEVTLGGTLSFWAAAQDEDYSDEIFSVFVCVEGKTNGEGCVKVGDDYFIQVGKDITATADFTEYSFGLAQFQGDRGRFAIRHYKTYDKFIFKIDDA